MLKAEDIMKHDVVTVSPRDSVKTVIEELVNKKINSVMVKDSNGSAVGIVTEYDLILAVSTVGHGLDVEHIMKKDYVRIKTETPLEEIADVFLTNRVKVLPVMDDKSKLVGVLSRRDLLERLYADA